MSSVPVVVTEGEFRRASQVFSGASGLSCVMAPEGELELAEIIRSASAQYAVIGHRRYEGPLYAALPPRGLIARFGVGHDGVDKARATAAGLMCTNTPSVLDQSVAEFTLWLIGAAARHLVSLAADMRQGRWMLRGGLELQGKRLAVIGCGQIGSAVARIASAGFGMHVVGCHRPGAPPTTAAAAPVFSELTDDFGLAVRDADFVTLHIPTTPATRHYVDAARLAMLAPKAWLINTARGAVVDELALHDALAAGRLAGAALDVFAQEPYVPLDPARDLRSLENVLLTPHVGSNTAEANRRMGERALQNVRWAVAGDFTRMDLLNPEVIRTFASA
ncbi:MAG: NAD(P)-dependent oxidoreductase [Vicinamibacterales bacterium]